MKLLKLSLLLLLSLDGTNAYKVLVYNSKFGHSHSQFLGTIADILADAGHDVTSLIPILDGSLKDGTENNPCSTASNRSLAFGPMFANSFYLTCKKIMEEPGLMERLRAEHFDVYITENFDVCGIVWDNSLGLAEAIQPKAVIGISTSFLCGRLLDEYGVPEAVSYRSAAILSSFNVHSFFDRLLNIYSSFLGRTAFYHSRLVINQALREHFGPEYPTVEDQSANVAYVLTNLEPLLDYAAPTMARIINIPGIGAKPPKKLHKYWDDILSRRKKAILLSFGSVVKSVLIPDYMKRAILTTISRFPDITFIWKYEELNDEFAKKHASKVNNLVLTDWMPQVENLANPNIVVFITHSGMGSTLETALRGIPGIFIPIFSDQPRNAGMMEFNGLGKVFSKYDLGDADKYRDNAQRISKMLAKKPFSSREQLIKHVEFAAEFGPSSALRPQSIDMNFIEYHNLDILLLLLIFIAVLFFILCKLVVFVFRNMRNVKNKDE